MDDIKVVFAAAEDLDCLTSIINAAYALEEGDTGVAFKRGNRIHDAESELLPPIENKRVLKAVTAGGKLVGCMVFLLKEDHIFFGPFAVDPEVKGRGVGKQMLTRIEEIATENACKYIEIDVVNHRTDIIPMYEKLGYVAVGRGEFPKLEVLTRPCHFIVMRKSMCPS